MSENYIYTVVEAPESVIALGKELPETFLTSRDVVRYDNSCFRKWNQLKMLWNPNFSAKGNYDRKESITVTTKPFNKNNSLVNTQKAFHTFCIQYLQNLEKQLQLPTSTLAIDPKMTSYAFRLVRYLSGAKIPPHVDASIMTCLYYQGSGLQFKIKDKWVDAPNLAPNEMLVIYGVVGERISRGRLQAVRHRVLCDERYLIAYFHTLVKDYVLQNDGYQSTTMAHIHQEARLGYANVNPSVVRHYCDSLQLSKVIVLFAWLSRFWKSRDEAPLALTKLEQQTLTQQSDKS